MNSFMSEVGSYLESVSTIEKKIENALKKSKINRVKKLLKAVVLVA